MDSLFPKSIKAYLNRRDVQELQDKTESTEDQIAEEEIPVVKQVEADRLPPVLSDNIFQIRILLIAIVCGTVINSIGLIGVAFKKIPDLAFSQTGEAVRVYPAEENEEDEKARIEKAVAKMIIPSLTFSNLRANPKDPTGFTFLQDESRDVIMEDNSKIAIPYSNWSKQYHFSEGSRIPNMRFIANIYKAVESEVRNTQATNLKSAFLYRFVFKSLPGQPNIRVRKEVSPGVWEVIFTGEIVRESPELGKSLPDDMPNAMRNQFRAFSVRTLVSRAPVVPKVIGNDEYQDLLWKGKQYGYEIGLLTPYNPQQEALPRR